MKLNAAYIHISINHTPILASLFGSGLLAYGLWRKSKTVENCGHALFLVGAISTIPVALAGLRAQNIVRPIPSVSEEKIQAHLKTAVASTALSWVQAALATSALRHNGQGSRSKAVMGISLLTNAAMFLAGPLRRRNPPRRDALRRRLRARNLNS
jgi:hypothetical protein